jgi:hypothetical protein
LFVGILLEYEYANNKRGLYGMIERYDANRGVVFIDMHNRMITL